jgi:hypothetical protein
VRGLLGLAVVAALAAACDQRPAPAPPEPIPVRPAPSEDVVARLAADRDELNAVRDACRADAPSATPALCAAASEAARRRFMGSGGGYQAQPVDPFPSQPDR